MRKTVKGTVINPTAGISCCSCRRTMGHSSTRKSRGGYPGTSLEDGLEGERADLMVQLGQGRAEDGRDVSCRFALGGLSECY
jgi:hypothetical protein